MKIQGDCTNPPSSLTHVQHGPNQVCLNIKKDSTDGLSIRILISHSSFFSKQIPSQVVKPLKKPNPIKLDSQ